MEKHGKDIMFIVFILVVVIMAIIYFTVPERSLFLQNQIKWWSELWDILVK
ncbi:MAG: hypothetical protein HY758_08175 [Nitrospirae bacterium]|nr:hypothetical protein [Nitrospirota bacterium]